MRFNFVHSMPGGEIVAEFINPDDSRAQVKVALSGASQAAPIDVAAALRALADKLAALS